MRPRIIPEVLREHAALAAFLWVQRDTLAAADPPNLEALPPTEARLEANLDALRIAGDEAWPFLLEQWEAFTDKGELFAFGFQALDRRDAPRLEQAVDFARDFPEADRGLVGAFRWLPPTPNAPIIRDWIAGADTTKRALAAAVLAEYRVDPGERLRRLMDDEHPRVRAHACHLAGLIGRQDVSDVIRQRLHDEDETVRQWASWSGVKLGIGTEAREALKPAAARGELAALRTVVESGTPEDNRQWLGRLAEDDATRAVAVRGAGMLGDRRILPWLLRQMAVPPLAEAAGASFLQLFPEARDVEGLFSADPAVLGPAFEADDSVWGELPVAGHIQQWAIERNLIPKENATPKTP